MAIKTLANTLGLACQGFHGADILSSTEIMISPSVFVFPNVSDNLVACSHISLVVVK